MPPSQDVFAPADMRHSSLVNALPLTPPSDSSSLSQRRSSDREMRSSSSGTSSEDDNTAAGMALTQEDSIYLTPAPSPPAMSAEEKEIAGSGQNESKTDEDDMLKQPCQTRNSDNAHVEHDSAELLEMTSDHTDTQISMQHERKDSSRDEHMDIDPGMPAAAPPYIHSTTSETILPTKEHVLPKGLQKADLTLDRSSQVSGWDFSDRPLSSRCPSALFQPYARYVGTQQSDRQTYNVEVTILTVDMEQCSMSGYLLIRGLTPEHPMLQTFFTGEIVGGPNQRHSFKTRDPSWGATDKVDLQHWLRFPPWRQLSSYAKRDMSFEFPLNDEAWWTQDHIFMRWKEHFLVPDHRQSNITGASFEGFYYICLNQAEGKISGVYFHSKSEKYQQLELTHVTKKGLGVFGVSPLIELR